MVGSVHQHCERIGEDGRCLVKGKVVLSENMLQLAVPAELRGRATGAWQAAVGFSPIGHLEMGLLASAVRTAGALLRNGVAPELVAFGACVVSRRLRDWPTPYSPARSEARDWPW